MSRTDKPKRAHGKRVIFDNPVTDKEIYMTNPTFNAIAANIALIEQRLARASVLATAAGKAAQQGRQNLAIGTLLPLQDDLADAEALLRTVFVLHRSRRDTSEGGAQ